MHSKLDGVAAHGARGPGDGERLAGPQREQVEGEPGGQAVHRQRGRSGQANARRHPRYRLAGDDDKLRLRAAARRTW
jgi:hypothetical protein